MFEMRVASVGPLRAYKMSIRTRMNKNLTRIQNELRRTRKVINSSKTTKNREVNELQLTIESIQKLTQTLLDASDDLSKLEAAENEERVKEEDFIDDQYNDDEELTIPKANSSKSVEFDLNFD
ncbi:uncharacterized protein LOC122853843 [Aphidius gifuensis]|uniref:uncharacterized protein LOC122853843 n=1 Tax=Aphidius gifuensis TaxID=684658 RepID=UPI001CDC32FB|nr:uncharacterized protein LOC122853843 [Aphidius gifuensis]